MSDKLIVHHDDLIRTIGVDDDFDIEAVRIEYHGGNYKLILAGGPDDTPAPVANDLDHLDDYLYSAANDYRYDTSDHIAAAVDDACAAWLRARGIGIHRPYVESDDPPAPVDDRAERDRLDRARTDFTDACAILIVACVDDSIVAGHAARANQLNAGRALRDALIAWDDTHHPDAAGDGVTG